MDRNARHPASRRLLLIILTCCPHCPLSIITESFAHVRSLCMTTRGSDIRTSPSRIESVISRPNTKSNHTYPALQHSSTSPPPPTAPRHYHWWDLELAGQGERNKLRYPRSATWNQTPLRTPQIFSEHQKKREKQILSPPKELQLEKHQILYHVALIVTASVSHPLPHLAKMASTSTTASDILANSLANRTQTRMQFLSLAPTTSDTYPSTPKEGEIKTRRSSSSASTASVTGMRFLKLGPVHFGEGVDGEGDWSEVAASE